jgi:LysR family hydrogen peroxide-inducible transcriptional activator
MSRVESYPFTLRQLQYALAVAQTGHFGRAAALCRVAQPSLSTQISALERSFGAVFFLRERSGVKVTAAGEVFLRQARRLLREADRLSESQAHLSDPLACVMRVGVIPTIAPYLLPLVVPRIRQASPQTRIFWVEEKTSVLLDALRRGEMEAAILAEEGELKGLTRRFLGFDRFFLALPSEDPLAAQKQAISLEALRGLSLLYLEEGHCLREQALALCASVEYRETPFRAISLSTLLQVVASGLGMTILPQLALKMEQQRACFAFRAIEETYGREIALYWRSDSSWEEALEGVACVLEAALCEALAVEKL